MDNDLVRDYKKKKQVYSKKRTYFLKDKAKRCRHYFINRKRFYKKQAIKKCRHSHMFLHKGNGYRRLYQID